MLNGRFLRSACDSASKSGATYVEARFGSHTSEVLAASSGEIIRASSQVTAGWGLRVLVDGGWGFTSRSSLDEADISVVVEEAIALARASAKTRRWPVQLAPIDPVVADSLMAGRVEHRDVTRDQKLAVLTELDGLLNKSGEVAMARVQMDLRWETMELVTSEGTEISQQLSIVGGGYVAGVEANGERGVRTFPHHGGWDYATAGFEWFEDGRLQSNVDRIVSEAALLTKAGPMEQTVTTVVLDPAMIGTALHETVGHATELDRILGEERDNFGSTFANTDRLGTFPYASPLVSVAADATYPAAAGSYAFDAEGVAAQRVPILDSGRWVGVTNSRECAAEINQLPKGTARASDWARIPMARMTNMVLAPGDSSLQSLIKDVDEGIYMMTDAATDIDDNRELCSFGAEIGWRIKNGELEEPVRRPFLYTDSHSFLRQCDGIGSSRESEVTGILGCGKGQPWQFIFTGQGGPPARFRNVKVGGPTLDGEGE